MYTARAEAVTHYSFSYRLAIDRDDWRRRITSLNGPHHMGHEFKRG